ncbi:MAG: hypothetical protein GY696_29215 [Gammaproteobacteria bacterium]|nr:hypothetical protein [Gammaproteobacteria bacterium]
MDRMGIWEETSSSEWVHPMVTVPKPDGGVRTTTDLSALNEYVILEKYPLPKIKDLFLDFSGTKGFSKLDLKKGYFHIPLATESKDLMTAITLWVFGDTTDCPWDSRTLPPPFKE